MMRVDIPMLNYFLEVPGMNDEVKVWAQMFFDDGSVTQGKYISRSTYDKEEYIRRIATEFLTETQREEGVLFIWGAGRVYAKKCKLLLFRRGPFKGSKTLRLRNL
jgi:hypothetical protein